MSSRNSTDWMWSQACELIEQAERMHRQFFRLLPSERAQAVWEPPVDVFETEQELTIVAALPGVDPGDIEIAIERGVLLVGGLRRMLACAHGAAIHRMEIPHGRFD